MYTLNKAPVNFPVTREDSTVNKGWIDWVLDLDYVLSGIYQYDDGINVSPKSVILNMQLAISESSYEIPFDVEDGVVSVDNFNGSDVIIAQNRVMVRDNIVTLPSATEGFNIVSGVLLRR